MSGRNADGVMMGGKAEDRSQDTPFGKRASKPEPNELNNAEAHRLTDTFPEPGNPDHHNSPRKVKPGTYTDQGGTY